jgi:L-asparaginase II
VAQAGQLQGVLLMTNPVLVEVTRGPVAESLHTGSYVVMDADGAIVASAGEIMRPVFPRSAVKAFQALPLLESGAADRLGFTPAELALAISSHSGEEEHAATSAAMLAKAARDVGCLECGTHWPMGDAATRKLAGAGGKPSALHNNCSGKHAGFVCLCCDMGIDSAGYVQPDHKLQRMLADTMHEMTGVRHGSDNRGTDGCSIPTYAVPLKSLASAFAKFSSGVGLGPERIKANRRLQAAAALHPFMVAGTGRFDTRAMTLLGRRAFTKTGAEGVFCAAFPELGYGVALKCEDGAGRAAEVVMAALIARYVPMSETETATFAPLLTPKLINWNGIEVGQLRFVG